MVTFDLSFRSMFIREIVEDEGSLWTEGSTSGLSINRGSYHGKTVQFFDGAFFPFVIFSFGAAYCWAGSRSALIVWVPFCGF